MHNEEHQSLQPNNQIQYDFEFAGGIFNSYFFQTNNGIIYEVIFKPSDYVFAGNELFKNNTFEFSILVVENPTNKNPPLDKLIPNTIANIFNDFFSNQEQRIIVYICETSDFKAMARNRKFNQWFNAYKGTKFIKIDLPMGQDVKGETYFTSMIISADNPYINELVIAFRKFVVANQK
jgi:hypothetical protein